MTNGVGTDYTEEGFCRFVFEVIQRQPDWLLPVIAALQEGLRKRIHDEAELRATAETALFIAYDSAKGKIPARQNKVVLAALASAAAWEGTPFQKRIREEMKENDRNIAREENG